MSNAIFPSLSVPLRPRRTTRLLMAAGLLMTALPAFAQFKAKVDVQPDKPRNNFYPTSIGAAADNYDGNVYNAATIQLLSDAGISTLRYPGNEGTDALYHWSTGAVTNPYSNAKAPAFSPDKQFPKALPFMVQLGTALITVNYGSNLAGTGGGEPAEAAAWVAYANGSTDNTLALGKDSAGNDWKTVGYWASLRAADPLPTDDGLNALRISHASPFGVQVWTIGHEPWNNGFYADHAEEPDLHAGNVPTSKDWGRHVNDKRLSPAAYGAAVVQFSKAMKAVDPNVLIGAAIAPPDPYKNWNADVLKAACGSIDFVAATLMEGHNGPPDYKLLVEEDLLKSDLAGNFGALMSDLSDKVKKSCPGGRFPQLAITNFGVFSWLPAKDPIVEGLFAADGTATLLESGAFSVDWSQVHSNSLLDDSNHPKPPYYGLQMLHKIGAPGDVFVNASTPLNILGVHAVKGTDGGLGLLFVNRDMTQSIKATVTVAGYSYASKGTRYDFNPAALAAGKGIVETPVDNLGATFTVELPHFGMTAIVIPKTP